MIKERNQSLLERDPRVFHSLFWAALTCQDSNSAYSPHPFSLDRHRVDCYDAKALNGMLPNHSCLTALPSFFFLLSSLPPAPVGASDRRRSAGSLPGRPVPLPLGGQRKSRIGTHRGRREIPHGGGERTRDTQPSARPLATSTRIGSSPSPSARLPQNS